MERRHASRMGGVASFGAWLVLAAMGCGSPFESLGVVIFKASDAGPREVAAETSQAEPAARSSGAATRATKGSQDDDAGTSIDASVMASAPNRGTTSPVKAPARTPLSRFVRDDSAQSELDAAELERLRSGSGACTVGIAYPSEGTVFPGGLGPPTIMWPVPADKSQTGALLRLHYSGDVVDYVYAVGSGSKGQLQVPVEAWREITARTDQGLLSVELAIGFEDEVQLCRTSLRIARGTLTGSLFYYQSSLDAAESFNVDDQPTGAQVGIYRLRLGNGTYEPFITQQGNNCVGCHAMNARGTKLVSMTADYHSDSISVTDSYYVYDISSGAPKRSGKLDNSNYGAVTPDGKFLLSVGTPDCTAGEIYDVPPNRGLWFVDGPAVARLQDTATGAEVTSHGLHPDWYMWMPQFSPDGRMVVFNHAKPDPAREGFVDRRELAVMDYDQATQTFSNLRVLVSGLGPEPTGDYEMSTHVFGLLRRHGRDGCSAPLAQSLSSGKLARAVCDGPCYPAWPTFTPDNRGVIFSLVDQPDFNHSAGRKVAAKAHLYYVEIATGRVVRLDNAMRVADPAEWGYDNYPSVLPVSVGGYAWLFWTGRRSWGTRGGGIFTPNQAGEKPSGAGNSSSRRIWGSAIRLAGTARTDALTDPSSPAFYLEGQGARPSMRVFAALNACLPEGSGCETGVDCCGGFCSSSECRVPAEPVCSKTMDACTTSADCCQEGTGQTCIGGFCDVIVLQ